MSHPFQVGKTFRNRHGEYVVQSIDGDEMTIRYVGGGTLKTKVSIQARIWENIQFEEQMARDQEREKLAQEARQAARKRAAQAKRERAQPVFKGFVDADLEPRKRGFAWASRKELGRLLAKEMTRWSEGEYGFWLVPRKPEIHVARQGHYDRDKRDSRAAFFVVVNEHGASFGLRVGNPGGQPKKGWHSPAFLAALAQDSRPRRALRAAMKEYDLSLDVYARDVRYGQVGRVVVQDRGLLWQRETADQEESRRMTWQDLVEYLRTMASKAQSDVYVRRLMPAAAALDAGVGVAEEILQVFQALLPMYEACLEG